MLIIISEEPTCLKWCSADFQGGPRNADPNEPHGLNDERLEVVQIQQTKLNPTTEPTSNQTHCSWNSSTCHPLDLFFSRRAAWGVSGDTVEVAVQGAKRFRGSMQIWFYDWLKHSVWPTSTVSKAVKARGPEWPAVHWRALFRMPNKSENKPKNPINCMLEF